MKMTGRDWPNNRWGRHGLEVKVDIGTKLTRPQIYGWPELGIEFGAVQPRTGVGVDLVLG